ncbi:Bug family tripartite tricarboxylate transporter substrate binding protein [Bradyrhizobium sp.]|uniref:Bug family tripartite tricarboxylate transporter substrate binding protein n=1 Tax=Bradyrhizobium sp. TaxID=376 RepID=UPI002BD1E7D9|nr:tripartite tricarboxylate transporter substrate binding protein [Bradyrhizobium sp.]HMM89317.1 tripartite tricarboxylate transporter substrate binding protein [Bradyrhizobium sp.]
MDLLFERCTISCDPTISSEIDFNPWSRRENIVRTALKIIACVVSALSWLPAVQLAHAVEWPTKIVKIVVPYGPGGGVDSFARPIASTLSDQLPNRIIIENRAGAGGTVGVLAAAKSSADGTVLLAGGVHQPMSEAVYPSRGYRIDQDFVPIAITAVVPNVLVVPAESRFATVADIIKEAKANPGKLTYCSSGNGTSQHIIGEMFKRRAGVDILHVPYRGTAPALTDLIANVCDMMFDGMGTSAPQIEGRKLKAIALIADKRSPRFPDIPAFVEAGGPQLDASIWYAIWAPAGTPSDLVSRIRGLVKGSLTSPAVARAWEIQGAEIPKINDEEIVGFVERETAEWTRTVTELGIKVD